MKWLNLFSLSLLIFNTVSCSIGQTVEDENQVLEPKAFEEKLKSIIPNQLIDVRTPGEFSGGRLDGALNLDWNGAEFNNQAETLDKNIPVFIYCLSGGRSAAAADYLRDEGFQNVYELSGGIMKWRAEKLPEVQAMISNEGMSIDAFKDSINVNQIVLVDFYAEWCAPCKKMKPELEALGEEMKDKLLVLRIEVDQNRILSEELGISALPVVQIYKNNELKWTNKGYTDKETLKQEINKLNQ
jgi:thioredoxin 1